MATFPRGVKAWLFTWHPMSQETEAEVPNRIAAILPSRTTDKVVELTIEVLYANHCAHHPGASCIYPGDQLACAARKQGYRAVRAIWPIYTCGNNPMLRAQQVEKLRLIEDGDGNEFLTWNELRFPSFRPGVDPSDQLETMPETKRRAMVFDPRTNTISAR